MKKNDDRYVWVQDPLEDMIEHILTGDPVQFQFRGRDYYIEGEMFDNDALGRVGSYYIADHCIDENGDSSGEILYPESGKYKKGSEMLAAKFLDGKTLIERYKELKFFDN